MAMQVSGDTMKSLGFCARVASLVASLAAFYSAGCQAQGAMTLPGTAGVTPGGSATYEIPISVPPGTAGMAPSLSLRYGSQELNGILGVGWSLGGIPSVQRCSTILANRGVIAGITFTTPDRFCLDGQLLTTAVSGATYGADGTHYRGDIDFFSDIISHGTAGTGPAWIEVHTKSGQVMQFGNTPDSQILAKGTATVRAWALNRVTDSKGNYYTVTYTNDTTNGQFYPIEIDYTGNSVASVAPFNKVQFVYGSRPDPLTQYLAGSLIQTTVLLTDVKTYSGASLVADYQLTYQQSSSTQRSVLTSAKICSGSGSCLPATTFTWQGQGAVANTVGFNSAWPNYSMVTGDFNGDGTTDILVCPPSYVAHCTLYYVNGSTLTTSSFSPPWGQLGVWAGDFNGDGLTDFIACEEAECDVYISTGTNFTFTSSMSVASTTNQITVADYNGDGKSDVLVCPPTAGATCALYLANGTSFTQTSFAPAWGGNYTVSADFNGDGMADFLTCGSTAGSACTMYYSSQGTSFTGGYSQTGWSGQKLLIADFNGDGLADIFVCPTTAGATCSIYYSTGAGVVASSFTVNWGGYNITTTDFNNDGKADLFACPPSGSSSACASYLSTGTSFIAGSFSQSWPGYNILVGDWTGIGAAGLLAVAPSGGNSKQYLTSFTPEAISIVNTGLKTTTFTYVPATNSSVVVKDSGTAYPQQDLVAPLYVVSRTDASNGVGGNYSTTYQYTGGRRDLTGRGFLGFQQVSTTDLQTSVVSTTSYLQSYPFIGLVASATKKLGSVTLSQTTNTYQVVNASGGSTVSSPAVTNWPYRVSLTQTVTSGADLDGTALPTVGTNYLYDAYNNPVQVTASTTDGFSKTIVNTYTNDTTNWYLGRLTQSTVTSIAPTP